MTHFDSPSVHKKIKLKVEEIKQNSPDPKRELEDLHQRLSTKYIEIMETETDEERLVTRTGAILDAQIFVTNEADKYEFTFDGTRSRLKPIQPTEVVTAPTLKQANTPTQVCCSRCGTAQLTAQKKGFGIVKGAALGVLGVATGGVVLGAAGLATGNIGRDKVLITCVSCGNQWKAGKHR